MRKLFALAGMATLALFGTPRADAAGNALKPYVVLILDTSGSMLQATGSGAPSCGGIDTKLNHARCAINKIANSYGDIVFALGRFRQVMGGATTAATFPAGCCTAGPSVGANGACAAGITCNTTDNQFELLTPLIDGNNSGPALWTNGTGNTCTAAGTDPEIWNADSNTPLEGTLNGAKKYWQGLQETNFTVWPAGGPASGFNPIVNDPFNNVFLPSGEQCRPYIVIFLTDGDETCGGNPQTGAANLLTTVVGGKTYRIKTKPIGFGTPVPYAPMEAMAHGGGAVDVPGVNEAFYASDEAGVELAISQIIEGSVRFELCNGLDDNCNGLIDEDFPNKGGVCDNGQQGACKRTGTFICTADQSGTQCSVGPIVPGVEICNGIDDDCDGIIDEGLPGCTCVAVAETCNNMDDDCDGKIDEGIVKQCGTGTCLGTQTCTAGVFGACTAQVPTAEICNGIDDNCDGIIDGITQNCSNAGADHILGTPDDTNGGPPSDSLGTTAACLAEGNKCLCHPGQKDCPAGGTGVFGACLGEVGPTAEICNGLDDDCDGTIDENTGGADCSTNCGIGTQVCVNGVLTCNSTPSTTDATCNNVDDNCNGQIDEDWKCSDPTGNSVPAAACACGAGVVCNGVSTCMNGTVQCVGGPIIPESCNCLDDDCDGKIDEGVTCGGGATCTSCQCAFPCAGGEFPCPLGKACVNNFCIADPCFGVNCPTLPDGTAEECVNVNNLGTCKSVCSQVTCPGSLVCVPQTGTCAPNDCSTFPAMCTASENCINGMCISNPCQGVTCPTDQYCEQGQCFSSCAGVMCPSNQRCVLGTCQDNPCGKPCPFGQVCHDDSGKCVDNPCGVITCPGGQYCNPNSGGCENDPCIGTTCPDPAQKCLGGTCFDPGDFQPDAGTEQHVTTGGGGGCNTGNGGTGGVLAIALALLALRRRKATKGAQQ